MKRNYIVIGIVVIYIILGTLACETNSKKARATQGKLYRQRLSEMSKSPIDAQPKTNIQEQFNKNEKQDTRFAEPEQTPQSNYDTINKTDREKELIAKYGVKYGTQIFEGNLVLGMTKAMCGEVTPKDIYDITVTAYGYGTMEMWVFNDRKYKSFLVSTFGLGIIMYPVYEQKSRYTFLMFTDDKLTSFTE